MTQPQPPTQTEMETPAAPLAPTPVEKPAVKPRPRSHWDTFTIGLILGWAAGIVYGIIKAPRSGAEARAHLTAEIDKAVGGLSHEIEIRSRQVTAELERDRVQEAIDQGKAAARTLQSQRSGWTTQPDTDDVEGKNRSGSLT